ncbi:ABC transporter permease [Streptomyces sp. NPDC006285]|uniref:ABC transporter permease n=1 Tax=Streptomyces sp. NPDC006285 TaxID=3364742 RepID=UPI00368F7366
MLTLARCLIILFLNGSVANPGADLRDAPIGLVSLDKGVFAEEAGHQNVGRQVTAGIAAQPQKPHRSVEWRTFASLAEAKQAIGRNELFAAVVLPHDYSTKMLSLLGADPEKPTVTVLTNHGAGSMASSIGEQIAESAVRGASSGAAAGILQQAQKAGATAPAANQALVKDPVSVTTQAGAPLGDRTGQGMTAFFYALLLMMSGFLGANPIHATTDSALGYSANELGPRRHLALPQHINRRQTLLTKYLIMVGVSAVMSAAILAVSAFTLHLDLPHSLLL